MHTVLTQLGIQSRNPGAYGLSAISEQAKIISVRSPGTGQPLAEVEVASDAAYEQIIKEAHSTYLRWRELPAPQRGEIVRQIGDELRNFKEPLARLITLEMGKIVQEGLGEVQEAIDIADFSVGLSRQLYGLTMHSERPAHRMYEQWHPLGIVGVITAFNFPMAVWAWNAMIAAVCGDVVIWKPSELTPLSALAINNIARRVAAQHGFEAVFSLVVGDGPELGKKIAADRRLPLISATGSSAMGRSVAEVVGKRLGKTILELGGNNALIVLADADLDLATRAIFFGAVGTAGQRCTTTRRVLVEKKISHELESRLLKVYSQLRIGDPYDPKTLIGPLITSKAVEAFEKAVGEALKQGGKLLCGGKRCAGMPSDLYVEPTIIRASHLMSIVEEETFAPILYLIEVDSLEQAIAQNNQVPQGLSSAIFTRDIQSAERFLSNAGSDCGIANVNIGTSGAEIGGAFGGEKDTGGGRESGSDSWKQYMRRQTCTINYSDSLPLAQGISFE